MQTRIVAITNQKGGVGKTTTAVNLASAATDDLHLRALLIDLDPQGHASLHVGLRKMLRPPVYRVLVDEEPLIDHVQRCDFGFDVLASGSGSAIAELHLTSHANHEQLRTALDPYLARWDCVVIDCPPSLGQLLMCALTCAHNVIVPMPLEFLNVDGFAQLCARIESIQRFNPGLRMAGVLATKTDERTQLAQLLRAELAESDTVMFDHAIRRNTQLAAAPWAGKPIAHHDPRSKGAADYRALVGELHERGVI